MEILSNVYAPYIGANGNWYINNEDTGVKAQGPTGPQGPAGCGIQGLIGQKGETGDRGPQGIQGPVGATGAQGLRGDKGDVGLQGEKGDTPELSTSLQEASEGKALDATMGKGLNDKITDLDRKLTTYDILSLDSDYLPFNIEKMGNIAVLSFARNKVALTANTPYSVGTIPSGYAPIGVVAQMIPIGRNGGVAFLSIAYDGKVFIRPYIDIAENDYVYNSVTYLCK